MEDIIQWLTSELNYTEGVDIFARYSKNQIMVRGFRTGIPARNIKKLEYEMKCLLKIPVNLIFAQKCSNQQLINDLFNKKTPFVSIPQKTNSDKTQNVLAKDHYILQAKEILKDLFTEISTIHTDLYNLGEGNDSKTVSSRKKLLKKRMPVIDRYETLYKLKEESFITGKIPDKLKQLLDKDTVLVISTKKRDDFSKLSDIKLLKTKNRLLSNITKTKNKLYYQSSTKKEKENPMPEGPKKDKIVKKLDILTKQFNEVTEILNKREKENAG